MNMLNTAKKRFENAKREFQTAAIDLKSGKIPAPSKGDKILYSTVLSGGIFFYSAAPAFAAKDILDGVSNIIGTYFDQLSGIAIGLGALLAVVALIMWFFFPSDRGAEQGKKWFIRILFCIGLLSCLGGIISLIQNMTAGQGFDASGYITVG